MKNYLKLLFKQLFCSHEYELIRTLHGDEIIENGGRYMVLKCVHCKETKIS